MAAIAAECINILIAEFNDVGALKCFNILPIFGKLSISK